VSEKTKERGQLPDKWVIQKERRKRICQTRVCKVIRVQTRGGIFDRKNGKRGVGKRGVKGVKNL